MAFDVYDCFLLTEIYYTMCNDSVKTIRKRIFFHCSYIILWGSFLLIVARFGLEMQMLFLLFWYFVACFGFWILYPFGVDIAHFNSNEQRKTGTSIKEQNNVK